MRLPAIIAAINTPITVTIYEGATARWSTTVHLKTAFRTVKVVIPTGVKAAFSAWDTVRLGITSTEEVYISNVRASVARVTSDIPLTVTLQLMQSGTDIEGATVTVTPTRNGSPVTASLLIDPAILANITTTGNPNYTASNLQFRVITSAGTDVTEQARIGQMTFDASQSASTDATVTVAVKGAATTYRTETLYYSSSTFRTDKFRLTDAEKASVISNSDLANLKLDITSDAAVNFSNFRISNQVAVDGDGGGGEGDGLWKTTGISYWPGFGVALPRQSIINDDAWQQVSYFSWAINSPKVVSLGTFFYWGDVQTAGSPATYNWTYVDRLLEDVTAAGKKVFFRIEPKTFTSSYALATPSGWRTMNEDFMYYDPSSDAFSAGTSTTNGSQRRVACIWKTKIFDGFVEFWRQFALRYAGSESSFQLISCMETAVRDTALNHPWSGWTEQVWIDAYNNLLTEMRTQMGSAWPLAYPCNTLSEARAQSVRDTILQNNLFITGPDIFTPPHWYWRPTSRSSAWNTIHRPLNGIVPIFQECQDGSPNAYHDYEISPQEALTMLSTPVTTVTASLPYGGMPMQGLYLTPNQYRGTENTYHFDPDWIAAIDAWTGAFPYVISEE